MRSAPSFSTQSSNHRRGCINAVDLNVLRSTTVARCDLCQSPTPSARPPGPTLQALDREWIVVRVPLVINAGNPFTVGFVGVEVHKLTCSLAKCSGSRVVPAACWSLVVPPVNPVKSRREKLCQLLRQVVDLQLALRVVPVVNPIHHSEKRVSRDSQIYTAVYSLPTSCTS